MRTLWLALLLLASPAFASDDPFGTGNRIDAAGPADQFAAVITGSETCSGTACVAPSILPHATNSSVLTETLPQDILDAIALCESDRNEQSQKNAEAAVAEQAKAGIEAQIAAAHSASAKAGEKLNVHTASMWEVFRKHGYPTPGPQPPGPGPKPDPPKPDPPTPPPAPVADVTLLLVTSMNQQKFACEPCKMIADAGTPAALTAFMGSRFRQVDYDSPEAQKEFPEVPRIPRWKLTRPDGSKEVKTGALTADDVKKWVGGKF